MFETAGSLRANPGVSWRVLAVEASGAEVRLGGRSVRVVAVVAVFGLA